MELNFTILKRMYHGNLKVFSIEKLATPTTTDNSLSPSISWYANSNFCVVFKGSRLKQKKKTTTTKNNATCTPSNNINFFIVYELDTWSRDLNSDFTLNDCLFGGVRLAKNADPDKNIITVCGIGFDSRSEFLLPDAGAHPDYIHLCKR